MKDLAIRSMTAVPLAMVLAVGLASGAQALAPTATLERWQAEATMQAYGDLAYGDVAYDDTRYDDAPYHSCHGRGVGTAAAACGTRTGGPVGGLF